MNPATPASTSSISASALAGAPVLNASQIQQIAQTNNVRAQALGQTPSAGAISLASSPTVMTDANVRENAIPSIQNKANNLGINNPPANQNNQNGNAAGSTSNIDDLYNATNTSGNDALNDPTYLAEKGMIDSVRASGDSYTNSLINSIKGQYEANSQILQAQQAASRKGTENALMLGGSSRYAPLSSQGILDETDRSNILTLNKLQSDENSQIATAQKAQQDQNYQLLDKSLTAIQSARDRQQKLAQDMYDNAIKKNQEIRSQQQADMQKENDTVKTLGYGLTDLLTGNAADDQAAIQKVADHYGIDAGKLMAEVQQQKVAKNKAELENKLTQGNIDMLPLDRAAKEASINASNASTAKSYNDIKNSNMGSNANQQKLEQQYRQVLAKEFSSRTGSLGVENGKVNQANHLNALFNQYRDANGNYNIPPAQYAEVAIGLANLVSPTGSVSDSARDAIMTKTAAGDFNGAISYITGTPIKGSTQAVFNNLKDSIDRQAAVATSNREAALQNMRDMAPTDLDPDRVDALNRSTQMVTYSGFQKGNRDETEFVSSSLKNNGYTTYQSAKNAVPAGEIGVVDNKTGQFGSIPPGEFNPSKYTRI